MCLSSAFANNTLDAKNIEWEYVQKAKIIKYLLGAVSWPTSTKDDPINVCVLGKIDSLKAITALNGEMVKDRKIAVSAVPNIKKAQQNCQLIFISNSENANLKKIVSTFEGKPVLLLGDMDHFAQNGGSMNFIVIKGIVALTVNVEALKKSNLSYNVGEFSQLTIVPPPEDLK